MSSQKLASAIETGVDYVFYIRREVNGVLVDFTDWTFNLVGREFTDSEELFSYTEQDAGVIEIGQFGIQQDGGSTLDHNLKITIPSSATLALRSGKMDLIHIGLMGTDPNGDPFQIIVDSIAEVVRSIAP